MENYKIFQYNLKAKIPGTYKITAASAIVNSGYISSEEVEIVILPNYNIMTSAFELLNTSIESLPLSNDLKALLSSRGYSNLNQLLQQKVSFLRMKDGLDLNHELELYNLVTENGLSEFWKEA